MDTEQALLTLIQDQKLKNDELARYIIDNFTKRIEKLEEENKELRQEINRLTYKIS